MPINTQPHKKESSVMKNNLFHKTIITFLILCIGTSGSLIHANSLPLSLNLPNDPYWQKDAQEANANINHFVEPADTINYTDYRYVGAHNAHVYPRFFKIIHQQDQSIIGNLSYGVRGLMLDTYNWNLSWPSFLQGSTGAKVCLSHDKPGSIEAVAQKGTLKYQALKYELRRIVEFMRVNPKAIITIILEDYADPIQTAQEIKAVTTEAIYNPLFTPTDLVNGQWPTLGWMRQYNKRLIIFSQRADNTDVTFRQFSYMVENQYSTTDENELCKPRAESQPTGALLAFNNFNGIPFLPPCITKEQLEYTTAQRIITSCKVQNFAAGKIFNSYWVDHIINSCNYLYSNNDETIFEYVNNLNADPDKTKP